MVLKSLLPKVFQKALAEGMLDLEVLFLLLASATLVAIKATKIDNNMIAVRFMMFLYYGLKNYCST